MFNYLAKCGWLFDGFFSHGQLAVESIRIQRSVEGFSEAGAGAVGSPSTTLDELVVGPSLGNHLLSADPTGVIRL